jgi:prepilin-type N-terminal cleavage/methylation domain-containing protein
MSLRAGATLAASAGVTSHPAGFSLLEVLVVLAVVGIIAAAAVPAVNEGMRRERLAGAARTVAMQVSTARLQAVTSNRRMRVRLNCPVPDQFRVVEVTGTGAIDAAADRCSEAAYPYPDPDAAARPDLDGPVMRLRAGARFGAVQEIEVSPRGAVTALAGSLPAFIEVTDGVETRSVRITAAGQIQIQ